jgi:hypothetical protein
MIRFPGYPSFIVFILFFTFHFSLFTCFAQQKKINQTVFDTLSKSNIMIGYCTLNGLSDTAFLSSYQKEYDEFKPKKELMNQMYSLLKGITVTIVMGTWCSDSREQVPRFFHLFYALEHSFPDPDIICVDRNKKAGEVSLEGLNIVKIPTFIVYFQGKELGRIIETPKATIDQDFLDILKK